MRHGLACLCIVGGLMVVGMTEGRVPTPVAAEPAMDKATLAEVRKLQEKRRDGLQQAFDVRMKLYQSGRGELGGVLDVSRRLLAVEVELAAGAGRVAAYEKQIELAQRLVEVAKAKHASARGNYADVIDAQDAGLEATIGLLKAGGKPKKVKK